MPDISFDRLTMAYSQRAFRELCERFSRSDRLQAVVIFDIDNMRFLNQQGSRKDSDELIKGLAMRIRRYAPHPSIVGRIEGDAFGVFLQDPGSEKAVTDFVQDIINRERRFIDIGGGQLLFSVSAGIAFHDRSDNAKGMDMIYGAELALENAKANGKNKYSVLTGSTNLDYQRKITIRSELNRIMQNHDIRYKYQPFLEFASGNIAGVEILSRIKSSRYGLIMPSEFLNIARGSDMMIEFDRITLEHSCKKINEFDREGCGGIYISVNVSGEYFSLASFADEVIDCLKKYAVGKGRIVIEVTEDTVIRAGDAAGTAEKLAGCGVELHMDDFGRGFSNMAQIQKIPFAALKLDKSLVDNIYGSGKVLLKKSIEMAKDLGMKVIAEGIENKEQYETLKEMGCDLGQGFLIGKPMVFEETVKYLHERSCGN